MAKWDYSTASVPDAKESIAYEEMLNKKGSESWELVTALPRDGRTEFYFKRPTMLRQ